MKNIRKKQSSISMHTVLRVDGMYYRSAVQALEAARENQKRIAQHERRVAALQSEWGSIQSSDEAQRTKYDHGEPIAIQLEVAETMLAEAWGPVLQQTAMTHLMCAACLEAHINERAHTALQGAPLEQFDKLSLEGKFLFLPATLGARPLDAGKEPFQSFAQVVRYRNTLAHFKHRSEPWKSPGIPEFLGKLGLTVPHAEKSIEATIGMLTHAGKIPGNLPRWISIDDPFFIDIEFVGRRSP